MAITPSRRPSEAPPARDAVAEACAAIYQNWRRYLPHHEALEQAAQFARRCRGVA